MASNDKKPYLTPSEVATIQLKTMTPKVQLTNKELFYYGK